jgi:hypothetical protein
LGIRRAYDKAKGFRELVVLEYLIATSDIRVSNFSICDKNDILKIVFDDLFGDEIRRSASVANLTLDKGVESLPVKLKDVGVPLIKCVNFGSVKCEDFCDCVVIVGGVSD